MIDQANRMDATLSEIGVHHRYLHYVDRGHMMLTADFVVEESLKFIGELEA